MVGMTLVLFWNGTDCSVVLNYRTKIVNLMTIMRRVNFRRVLLLLPILGNFY